MITDTFKTLAMYPSIIQSVLSTLCISQLHEVLLLPSFTDKETADREIGLAVSGLAASDRRHLNQAIEYQSLSS